MREQHVRACIARLGDGIGSRIERAGHARDGGMRIADEQAGAIPRLGVRGRIPLEKPALELAYRQHSHHLSPAETISSSACATASMSSIVVSGPNDRRNDPWARLPSMPHADST